MLCLGRLFKAVGEDVLSDCNFAAFKLIPQGGRGRDDLRGSHVILCENFMYDFSFSKMSLSGVILESA